MKRLLLLLIPTIFLASCATSYDVDLNKTHTEAYETFQSEASHRKMSSMMAIKSAMSFECAKGEQGSESCGAAKAMSGAMASFAIANIPQEKFDLEKPTLGTDTQKHLIDKAERLINPIVHFKVVDVIAGEKGNVYNNKGDVVNSGNRQETITTTVGDQNRDNSSSSEKDKDESVSTDDHSATQELIK